MIECVRVVGPPNGRSSSRNSSKIPLRHCQAEPPLAEKFATQDSRLVFFNPSLGMNTGNHGTWNSAPDPCCKSVCMNAGGHGKGGCNCAEPWAVGQQWVLSDSSAGDNIQNTPSALCQGAMKLRRTPDEARRMRGGCRSLPASLSDLT